MTDAMIRSARPDDADADDGAPTGDAVGVNGQEAFLDV